MRRVIGLQALGLALAIAATGCGGGGGGGAGGGGGGATEPAAPPDTKAEKSAEKGGGGGEVEIGMVSGNQFDPAEETAAAGDTVVWTNDDQIPHNATAQAGAEFASENLEPGDTFEWEAAKAGEVSYECTLHPGMEGTITVE